MTMRERAGYKALWVEAPVELVERLKTVAERNDRSFTAEAVRAFKRHVEAEEAALGIAPPGPKGKKGGGK
jgi:hypothetical protein